MKWPLWTRQISFFRVSASAEIGPYRGLDQGIGGGGSSFHFFCSNASLGGCVFFLEGGGGDMVWGGFLTQGLGGWLC